MIVHEVLQDATVIALIIGLSMSIIVIGILIRRQQAMRQELNHLGRGIVMLMTDLHNRMEEREALTDLDKPGEPQHERYH